MVKITVKATLLSPDTTTPLEARLAAVARAIETRRFRFTDEDELQAGLHVALAEEGLSFTREVVLSTRDRIDLLEDGEGLPGGAIGIEVKIAGTLGGIARQAERYAEHARIGAVVLVTSRMQHTTLRKANVAKGKPFRLIYVGSARL